MSEPQIVVVQGQSSEGFLDRIAKTGCGCVVAVFALKFAGICAIAFAIFFGLIFAPTRPANEANPSLERQPDPAPDRVPLRELLDRVDPPRQRPRPAIVGSGPLPAPESTAITLSEEQYEIGRALHAIHRLAVAQAEKEAEREAIDASEFPALWIDRTIEREADYQRQLARWTGWDAAAFAAIYKHTRQFDVLRDMPTDRYLSDILKRLPKAKREQKSGRGVPGKN